MLISSENLYHTQFFDLPLVRAIFVPWRVRKSSMGLRLNALLTSFVTTQN